MDEKLVESARMLNTVVGGESGGILNEVDARVARMWREKACATEMRTWIVVERKKDGFVQRETGRIEVDGTEQSVALVEGAGASFEWGCPNALVAEVHQQALPSSELGFSLHLCHSNR